MAKTAFHTLEIELQTQYEFDILYDITQKGFHTIYNQLA